MTSKKYIEIKKYIRDHNWCELTFQGLKAACFHCNVVDERTVKTYLEAMEATNFITWDRKDPILDEDIYTIPYNIERRERGEFTDPDKIAQKKVA